MKGHLGINLETVWDQKTTRDNILDTSGQKDILGQFLRHLGTKRLFGTILNTHRDKDNL